MKTFHTLNFVISIVLALIFSAGFSFPVLADEAPPVTEQEPSVVLDETPPPSEGEIDSAYSDQAPIQTEDAPPPVEETEISEMNTLTEEDVSDDSSVEEVLEQLPPETQIVVLDETGEALPLASVEAEGILEVADPQWCPVGVTPGSASCSGVKLSFNGTDPNNNLIQWLKNNQPNKAGVIWIADDYVGTIGLEGGTITLNGNDYGTMANFALTINGGWVSGTTLDPNTPSTFNVPFSIINWTGAVTINNIVVTNASGVSVRALNVATMGNITLNNVDVSNNSTQFGGAYLDNTSWNGNAVVNNSTFNNNTGIYGLGLQISLMNGTVTLKNVIANGNSASGVLIDNTWGTSPKAVTLQGTNHFSNNGGGGLSIFSMGVITISNVTAVGNTGGMGVFLDNCSYEGFAYNICMFGVANGVTIKGTNNFSENGWDGLRVYSGGVINASNITANGNGTDALRPDVFLPDPQDYDANGKGVFLHNSGAWTAKPITITGTNTFNNNASTGLFVYSYGAIKANNITANDNGCDTFKDTDPDFCAGAYLDGNGVTLTGYSYFIDNARDGLIAYSYNVPISLSNLYAKGNDEAGVVVSAAAPINILGTNTFLENNEAGLAVYSTGAVTLNNLTANNNGFEGVYVDNTYATKPMPVTIKGVSIFNGNSQGLTIFSYGAVITNGVTALYNDYGVYINNCLNSGQPCTTYSPQPVTMNGYNNISYNNENGLEVRSAGVITVSNIVANFNLGGWGAYLDNWWDGAKGGVTIKGYGIFSNNGGDDGLSVWSTGAITLSNITANGNAESGVIIRNYYDELKPVNVTISGTNIFNLNGSSGLRIFSYGTVTLNNITANQNDGTNHGFGVHIDNATDTVFARPVTLNGTNTFNNNIGGGLSIASIGAIKVNNVTASGNEGHNGITLNNQFNLFTSPITITGYGVFNQNFLSGMLINSNGAITFTNLTANENGDFGALIDNYYNALSTSTVNVTITGSNVFNNNGQSGLRITTDGMITVSNITANYNGEHGADLNNSNYANGAIKTIVLSGSNMFNNNTLTGLTFSASGAVTLTRIIANYNNDTVIGPELSAGVQGVAGSTINLTCGSLYNNEGNGFNLTGTIITLSGVYTSGTNNHVGTLKLTRACPLP